MADRYPTRVLVANRGEIAVRIIRACAACGVDSVAVVSEADRAGMAARLATRSLCIGPAPARSSYLRPELLVHAALTTGCDALHPGYGFLSEQPALPDLCAANGITFIGPSADVIGRLGNKLEARRLAEEAGVPVLPGSTRIENGAAAEKRADEMGYPVLIKAAAGGGGRGMKVVEAPSELAAALQTTASEARGAFGDSTLYLERFIADARHVEVQVLGDGKGRVLHLADRDCSLQRRYQKLVEEAPAADIPADVRERMHQAALRIVRALDYESAGTVEFLYDKAEDAFYFLEVNTRLQVEHPVTEMVTGIDIVAAQLRIAAGGGVANLPDRPDLRGHAIEARITAESPADGFRPSPGRITRWDMPRMNGLRIDTHCEAGALVPPYYDSLIAKVIAHAHDRAKTIDRLRQGLQAMVIEGVETNRTFLLQLLADPDFAAMRHNTGTVDRMGQAQVLEPA